jgi:hypothetical protein
MFLMILGNFANRGKGSKNSVYEDYSPEVQDSVLAVVKMRKNGS